MGISLDKAILGITGEQDKDRLYGHQSRQGYPTGISHSDTQTTDNWV